MYLYSPFPRKWYSKCSPKCKSKSSMVVRFSSTAHSNENNISIWNVYREIQRHLNSRKISFQICTTRHREIGVECLDFDYLMKIAPPSRISICISRSFFESLETTCCTSPIEYQRERFPCSSQTKHCWICEFFFLDRDNLTERAPRNWRWRLEAKVMPYVCGNALWLGAQAWAACQLGAEAQYQVRADKATPLSLPFSAKSLEPLLWICPCPSENHRKSKKFPSVMTKGSPSKEALQRKPFKGRLQCAYTWIYIDAYTHLHIHMRTHTCTYTCAVVVCNAAPLHFTCIHLYVHTHMCIYLYHTRTHTYTYTCTVAVCSAAQSASHPHTITHIHTHIYMCTYIFTHRQTYTYTYCGTVCSPAYSASHTCTHTYIHIRMYTYIHIHIQTQTHVHIHVHLYRMQRRTLCHTHIYTHNTHTHMYAYVNIHRHAYNKT